MKTKELKNLAKKIAECELALQKCTSENKDTKMLQEQIIRLCGSVTDMEDMVRIDEYVQDILKEKNS